MKPARHVFRGWWVWVESKIWPHAANTDRTFDRTMEELRRPSQQTSIDQTVSEIGPKHHD